MQHIKFKSPLEENAFFDDARTEVSNYFKDNNISSLANAEMVAKTIFWLLFWALSWYSVILFKDHFWIAFCLGVTHMVTHLMIAFNIMHDANHDAIFKSKKANHYFSYFIELLGCNRRLWIISHNKDHHTFVNVYQHDSNIEGYNILRLTPEEKLLRYHKYQWLYATFIYALVTVNYATIKDIKMLFKYVKESKFTISTGFIFEFIFFKIIYYTYIFLVPIFVFGVSFKLILLYWLVGHFINGIFLSLIFVTGHLTEKVFYPKVVDNCVETNWAVNVVNTTGDYSASSKLEWLVGGVNIHVSHHLFPKICHVHYKKIAPIIRASAVKHGLTYREIYTFGEAMRSHFVLLKALGKPDYK
jgi:linoleoyl-CoA desaturase